MSCVLFGIIEGFIFSAFGISKVTNLTVNLVIEDGDAYWFVSGSVWLVYTNDPNGQQVWPYDGTPAYPCARVTNNGTDTATSVRVDFWIEPISWNNNPEITCANYTVSSATPIGAALPDQDIPAGSELNVISATQWSTIYGKSLIAVASCAEQPLPNPFTKFNTKTNDFVAQNITAMIIH